ncbi:hypothetical protein C4D60_Mb08t27250 [Musa balbisiana]|uniref:Uncharacterized protein n=1 Tax=Musa balbisiana TaxID=52838 RepID=A0A4S8K6V5_MUSBA|nr:hypothetical protein C4D60_Mb08t27250 [Musa balbisiana]
MMLVILVYTASEELHRSAVLPLLYVVDAKEDNIIIHACTVKSCGLGSRGFYGCKGPTCCVLQLEMLEFSGGRRDLL